MARNLSNNLEIYTNKNAVDTEYARLVKNSPFILIHKPTSIMLSLSLYQPHEPRIDLRLIKHIPQDDSYAATRCGFYFPTSYLPEFLAAVKTLASRVSEWEKSNAFMRPLALQPASSASRSSSNNKASVIKSRGSGKGSSKKRSVNIFAKAAAKKFLRTCKGGDVRGDRGGSARVGGGGSVEKDDVDYDGNVNERALLIDDDDDDDANDDDYNEDGDRHDQ
ncbi:uncharacterized protein LOC129586595 [Paramacrobiotus metropolitanus]|uniref:uncharacterized protein LOC129586595 n=1 Tax=Paramacrobiotus metropolitanus TaxID=2943436 RepID=UPI00244583C3|nr:uncharacterized protein LOC129586595 [Paramacrobiotus metropolitanus]XP_055335894.1 uncharacterized protein LOC129586595 [Paramacrobiotus metropolitanus]